MNRALVLATFFAAGAFVGAGGMVVLLKQPPGGPQEDAVRVAAAHALEGLAAELERMEGGNASVAAESFAASRTWADAVLALPGAWGPGEPPSWVRSAAELAASVRAWPLPGDPASWTAEARDHLRGVAAGARGASVGLLAGDLARAEAEASAARARADRIDSWA